METTPIAGATSSALSQTEAELPVRLHNSWEGAMTRDLIDISWEGEVIGQIEDMTFDNFHVYGTWQPASSPKTADFLARLAEEEHVLFVEIGHGSRHWTASAEVIDRGQIELLWQAGAGSR